MLVDLLKRLRAALAPALLAAALLAAGLPAAPAQAQMAAPPATMTPPAGGNMDPPAGGGGMDPPMMGGMMPPMGGMGDMPMGGMGDMPGMGGDGPTMPAPGNAGDDGDWMSNPMLMRRQMERNSNRGDGRANIVPASDAGEAYIPDEVIFTVDTATAKDRVADILKRNDIYVIEQTDSQLAGVTVVRARILNQRPVMAVTTALAADQGVLLAQPNVVYRLNYAGPARSAESPPLQYALGSLRLPQAHGVARGNEVLVGMVDSAVDRDHPDLDGAIAAMFDATAGGAAKAPHGTAIASLIAGRGRLTGSAPAARLLVARAFDSASGKGNSFTVLKSLDWLAARGARVINLSFTGIADPIVRRALRAAYLRNIILVAAAGNAGPNSPPLYPGADANVLAVTATDSADRLYRSANRGNYIVVAAPGVDVFVAAPDGGYAIQSGTSFSSAEISGIAALMLQRRPGLTPDQFRAQLIGSARPVAPGVKVADAYKAVTGGAPAARPKARR